MAISSSGSSSSSRGKKFSVRNDSFWLESWRVEKVEELYKKFSLEKKTSCFFCFSKSGSFGKNMRKSPFRVYSEVNFFGEI